MVSSLVVVIKRPSSTPQHVKGPILVARRVRVREEDTDICVYRVSIIVPATFFNRYSDDCRTTIVCCVQFFRWRSQIAYNAYAMIIYPMVNFCMDFFQSSQIFNKKWNTIDLRLRDFRKNSWARRRWCQNNNCQWYWS